MRVRAAHLLFAVVPFLAAGTTHAQPVDWRANDGNGGGGSFGVGDCVVAFRLPQEAR